MSSVSPSPLIALISSECSQKHAHNRGFKSLSHFIFPFTSHECQVREPIDNLKASQRIRLDIRDISSDGHLLTLSVLPYVLIQALKTCTDVSQSIKLFRDVLARCSEPSEHESFGHYLACIFVVSTEDENPLGEFSKMIQTQQTLYNTTSTLMIPGHCSTPKWAAPHAKTPRHYILLHDSRSPRSSTERRDELLAQMCATYGNDNCQMLQLDSDSESAEMKGVWDEIDEFNDVLEKGLEEAHQHSTDAIAPGPNGASNQQSPSSPTSSVATISSTMPAVGSVSPNSHPNSTVVWKSSKKLASLADAKAVQAILSKFLDVCLIPYVEKEMRFLYETAGQKKGIGKSFTSMKRWFGSGTALSNMATPITYAWDSSEMQTRRLADLLLMFGFPNSAFEQYRGLKRDLEADKAMAAHAVALEMCCVALHSAQPQLNANQFMIKYLETPVSLLIEHAKRYPSILRCAFNIADIYSDLGLHKEAALNLAKVSSIEGDHLVAVAQTLAAEQFEKAGMGRKASFHRVLAANRFSNAAIPALSFDCYRLALPAFDKKHWGVLDEHLAVRLLEEGQKAGVMTTDIASECIRRLVAVCPKLSPSLQTERLRTIVNALDIYFPHRNEPVEMLTDIPKVEMETVKAIYGERPLWNEIDENEHQSVSSDGWITVERAAHHALFGASAPYRGMQLVSDEHSDNQKIRETPAGERFRVMVDLTNPLKIPIHLQNLRLSVSDIHNQSGIEGSEKSIPELGALEHLQLDPEETKTIELYVFPRVGCLKFRVDGLLFQLAVDQKDVEARVPLKCRGKRLNKTAKQQKSKIYTNDERLSATVAQKPWPLVEFRVIKSPHQWSYCDQAQRYQLEIENIGHENVMSMCLATNAFDRVAAGSIDENEHHQQFKMNLAANNAKVATFRFEEGSTSSTDSFLKIGEKKRIFFDVRSSDEPTGSTVAPKQSNTVILIAYRSSNGTMRQWRRVIDGERRRLIALTAEILDLDTKSFSIHLKNCVAVSQAALSRVEILRIRTDRNEASTGIKNDCSTTVLPSVNRRVEIESEQTDTIVARLVPLSQGETIKESWLTTTTSVTPPKWPCPAEIHSTMDDEFASKIAEKIGILWKANIVNNEGLVTSFIGESFIDDPFVKLKTLKKDDSVLSSLRISCETTAKEISHNFSASHICELPITLLIQNKDLQRRPVSVSIKLSSKVREPVDGIHLVAPENRHQMWIDRPVRKQTIGIDDEAKLEMKWKITHAAVYDVGGANLSIEAIFEGSNDAVIFKVPSVLSVVKSSSYTVV
ncbi:Trafficking protein particle complex subunit 8 [Caenorhabditis elegans]|uniref:Trafficking protein particle complex subunit 8 n=1 Tax=Caenorhabditis elegans TaxID=6239 RepID=H2L043_CAEEL|nr:Trafficking protein particle complex subunit 8 [Caenorhabditis elegans]CCD71331.1 Trafficking protein particle complex subunit 8 [Caenorhabditis elegans]|eukprot:NP_491643.2 TRansport Protein Particle [Caenorhabditis elegans]